MFLLSFVDSSFIRQNTMAEPGRSPIEASIKQPNSTVCRAIEYEGPLGTHCNHRTHCVSGHLQKEGRIHVQKDGCVHTDGSGSILGSHCRLHTAIDRQGTLDQLDSSKSRGILEQDILSNHCYCGGNRELAQGRPNCNLRLQSSDGDGHHVYGQCHAQESCRRGEKVD